MRTMILLALAGALALASPVKADPAYNWTGAYAGAHVGYAWGNTTASDDMKDWCSAGDTACIKKFVGPFNYDTHGVFGGGTLGYNVQWDRIVVGVEGDLGYLDLSGSGVNDSSHVGNHQNLTTDGGLYGDITGRIGVLVMPGTLAYGKGGLAFFDGEAAQATTAAGYTTHATGTFTGWVAGGGVEQKLSDRISLKIEFLHFDFGTQDGDQTSVSDPPIGHVYGNHHNVDADSLKIGINYLF